MHSRRTLARETLAYCFLKSGDDSGPHCFLASLMSELGVFAWLQLWALSNVSVGAQLSTRRRGRR
jgi:hypothetical protein